MFRLHQTPNLKVCVFLRTMGLTFAISALIVRIKSYSIYRTISLVHLFHFEQLVFQSKLVGDCVHFRSTPPRVVSISRQKISAFISDTSCFVCARKLCCWMISFVLTCALILHISFLEQLDQLRTHLVWSRSYILSFLAPQFSLVSLVRDVYRFTFKKQRIYILTHSVAETFEKRYYRSKNVTCCLYRCIFNSVDTIQLRIDLLHELSCAKETKISSTEDFLLSLCCRAELFFG